MTNQPEPSFERELDHVWGAALDWKNSPDFLDEDEATYIRYRDNVIASALIAHNQSTAQAVQTAEAAAAVQLRKYNDFIRMVKREAVREFAERVKAKATSDWGNGFTLLRPEDIDTELEKLG